MFSILNSKNLITRTLIIILIVMMTASVVNVYAEDLDETTLSNEATEVVTEPAITTGPAIEDEGSEEEIDLSGSAIEMSDKEEVTTSGAMDEDVSVLDDDEMTIMAMTQLSSSAVAVSTYAELKSAILDTSNGYTEFYLTEDIKVDSSMLTPSAKPDILISGNDPFSDETHTFTDNIAYRITVSAGSKVTMKDMKIDGYNFYGTISTDLSGVYIKYDNVEYNGPQLCYGHYATLHIKDSDITLPASKTEANEVQEVAEVSRVVLEGKTTIKSLRTDGYYPFYLLKLQDVCEIRVLPGADAYIEAYNYMILQGTAGTAQINIEDGGSLSCNVKGGMTTAGARLGAMNIGDNGTFKYFHDGTKGSYTTVVLGGNLTVGNNGTLDVRRSSNSLNGDASTRILIRLDTAGAKVEFNDPKRVILVNGLSAGAGLIRLNGSTGTLDIKTDVMNLWENLPSGFDSSTAADPLSGWNDSDLPTRIWNQIDFDTIDLTASYSTSGTHQVNPASVAVNGAYVPATTKNALNLDENNFLSTNTKMFTCGQSSMGFDEIITKSDSIAGRSPAGSYVIADYETESGTTSGNTTADNNSTFDIPINSKLIEDSVVLGTNQINFIRAYTQTTVTGEQGALMFHQVPQTLNFISSYMPISDDVIGRADPGWAIKVKDTRNYSNTWYIYASIDGDPLSTEHNGNTYYLPNALVYKMNSTTEIFGSAPIHIYSGQTASDADEGITVVNWNENEGPLININTGDQLLSNKTYTTTIKWTLVDAPL